MPSNPPPGYHTLTSQAIVEDARATLAFVEDVFGGEVLDTFEEEGRIRHSEIRSVTPNSWSHPPARSSGRSRS